MNALVDSRWPDLALKGTKYRVDYLIVYRG